jgi:apolipoprotein N-acyltransferase
LVPISGSYFIFRNFEEKGETVNIALIQPNLDPYTEKFNPQNHARHVAEFFRTAEAVIDDETQYLFGPETLIVEQIDERDPSASIYYRNLLEFRKKYPKLNILLGVHSYQKLGNQDIPPGSRFNREQTFTTSPSIRRFFCPGALHRHPSFTTKPS